MRVIGFSVGHDKGAVLIEDGKILIGITQERLSRIKHDGAFSQGELPINPILYCLENFDLTVNDVDLFVYSTTEIVDETITKLIVRFPSIDSSKILSIPHHLAHAYSAFFSSTFDEAAIVVADASGSILSYKNGLENWYGPEENNLPNEIDWTEAISIFHFTREKYEEVYKKWIPYPTPLDTNECTSLGTMYSTGCHQVIFEPASNTWPAGKLMGLASYADKQIVNEAPEFVKELKNDICITNNKIYPKVDWSSDFYSRACVAGIYQREQERASIILAKMAKNLTGSKNICVAGGSFLNCNSNERILNSGLYENCYFIPPSDDSGIPLGCAFFGTQLLKVENENKLLSPYFGKSYTKKDIITAINSCDKQLNYKEFESFDELIEEISHWLTQNRVIGWFQGGSEIGPRALGNRSILASPINSWMTGHINSDIKKREKYRPFAPAVLFEYQSEVFESDVYSPYMLVTTTVKKDWRNKIPAVTHVDNSARHQSVTSESNPKFYRLLESFYKKTQIPVLLNTSFNGPKEPIVESPENAIKTFLNCNLDLLVLENFVFYKKLWV